MKLDFRRDKDLASQRGDQLYFPPNIRLKKPTPKFVILVQIGNRLPLSIGN